MKYARWTEEEIIEAASHVDVCPGPPECRGRYPEYSECAVASLARQYIDDVRALKKERDDLWLGLTLIKNHGSDDPKILKELASSYTG